ncbi:hybrid sensor histidine kinase/response regulator [Bradyrhizobium sp. 1]|uniref:hybrid sensor histidine kinase/response regulator n=1 Tax=Bradyrhizobium sp. 1 TaxID=241591 RepID=UPI001FF705D4|nr:hybrid sensor histidine kinase/response regulator [Bradyrhizobium sp. 1]
MFVAWGPELGFIYNDAYAEILAGKHPAAFGERFQDIWAEIWDDIWPLVQKAMAGEATWQENLPLVMNRRGFDEQTWFTFSYSSVRDATGEVMGMFCAVAETTAQVLAETALRESEAKAAAITNSIDQMIWSTRPDGFHDFYNQRWYEYTGVPQGSTDGEAWNGMFHPDDQEEAWSRWRHCLETGEPYHIEYRLRHRSGQYRWVLGRAQPVRDADGAILRWYGTCTDIDDMVAAREILARSREELEQLVEERTEERNQLWSATNLLVAVVAFDSTIREVNPAWAALLGWPQAEIVERSYTQFIHPDDVEGSRVWADKLAEGESGEFENRYLSKDGTYRWIAWSVTASKGAFHCIGRDIHRQKEQAEALRAAEEALRQAQKMEAVGHLTGGIAHDFNNMLSIVMGSLDLLKRRMVEIDPRAKRYLEAATDGARRAALLTQRLLAFSRQQPLNPQPIDINKLVSGMSEFIRGSLGSDVRLETVLGAGVWRIAADANQLENVLLNLAVNARDAMPDGGRLTIETHNAHLDDRYVASEPGTLAGQYVLIAVTDTGSGMPADVIAKAFDPFFTTKAVGKGTGLGLSQVYGFVKQSGGHVKIYSEPGEGTTFKVYLPRLVGSEEPAFKEKAVASLPNGDRQELILVVEDEPAVRQFSVDALTELGYRVIEAEGAKVALQLLDENPQVRLLFTDIVMPDTNGAKLSEEALRRRGDLKVLFTTGYTPNAVLHNRLVNDGVAVLGKPFTIEELAAKVREVLDT